MCYSSIILCLPYFLLPKDTLYGYKFGFLALMPISLQNHLRNYDPENLYELKYTKNNLINRLDHVCITFLNSISLFRNYYITLLIVLLEYKTRKINKVLFFINYIYQIYISSYKLNLTFALILCGYGFNYNKQKTWLRHKRYIWHSGLVIYTYYAGLCVNETNSCLLN